MSTMMTVTPRAIVVNDDVIGVPNDDGQEGIAYHVRCERHQWVSLPVLVLELLEVNRCPHCAVEYDAGHGRTRYRALHALLTR